MNRDSYNVQQHHVGQYQDRDFLVFLIFYFLHAKKRYPFGLVFAINICSLRLFGISITVVSEKIQFIQSEEICQLVIKRSIKVLFAIVFNHHLWFEEGKISMCIASMLFIKMFFINGKMISFWRMLNKVSMLNCTIFFRSQEAIYFCNIIGCKMPNVV